MVKILIKKSTFTNLLSNSIDSSAKTNLLEAMKIIFIHCLLGVVKGVTFAK